MGCGCLYILFILFSRFKNYCFDWFLAHTNAVHSFSNLCSVVEKLILLKRMRLNLQKQVGPASPFIEFGISLRP
ncbi:hypothetical protein QVD17_07237 [Tagetes erecta]|uniref:Uncharacterized protein n=1 Tax=Tagetes erecta TaxID=13708 RepID=A0AAD8LND9_TARER|nr:hypothetical protein QVD17_07237 [Tagetes erecta]